MPFLNTSENQSSDIFRFKALHNLLDKDSHNQSSDKLLQAKEILHEPIPTNTTTCMTDPSVCIPFATMNYNINSYSTQIPIDLTQAQKVCNTKHKPLGCAEKIWYLYRLFNLTKTEPYTPRIDEDTTCNETVWKCTPEELSHTTHVISDLSQTGYTSIFSDNNANVLGLGRALDTFISDLNSFIIFSFIVANWSCSIYCRN